MAPTRSWHLVPTDVITDARERCEREQQITRNMGLVYHAVSRLPAMPLYGMAQEDLVEAGMVGLIQSVNNFDPMRGFAFTTFAMPRIRGAMLDAVRAQRAVPWPAQYREKLIRQSVGALEETLGRPATTAELDEAIGTEAICFL